MNSDDYTISLGDGATATLTASNVDIVDFYQLVGIANKITEDQLAIRGFDKLHWAAINSNTASRLDDLGIDHATITLRKTFVLEAVPYGKVWYMTEKRKNKLGLAGRQ